MSETDPFLSEEGDDTDERTQLEEYFSQSLEVDLLLRLCPDEEDAIYQIVDLLVDTCYTKRKMLRMKVLAVSCITNMATGIQTVKHSYARVLEIANQAGETLCRWLGAVIQKMEG